MTELNNENYNTFINDGIVLVDVMASWCGPCKTLSPIITELSNEYSDRISVGKLDADTNKEILKDLGVRNIPTIFIYKNGEVVDKLVGSTTKQNLQNLINKHIEN